MPVAPGPIALPSPPTAPGARVEPSRPRRQGQRRAQEQVAPAHCPPSVSRTRNCSRRAEDGSRLNSGVRRGKVDEEVVEQWRTRGQTACRCRRKHPRGVNVSPPPGTAAARSRWRLGRRGERLDRGGATRRPEPRYADRHNSARLQHECCKSGHLCGERATICREGGRPIACSLGRREPAPGRGTAALCRPA